jgi:MoaA/NifB/PqqE/SkfB family radical SAM enzyme
MYFDQFGKVRACCQNTGVYLGDVRRQTLREIWESADAERMRTTLEGDDYSAGCDFCEWQVREGNGDIVFARQFDVLRPDDRRPVWPRQMEFSLTNTCNLACAMCNGDWSSTIRAKREGRPPLMAAYDNTFYEQLTEFLPHLEDAKFLGGEPFLGKEPLRVMEMLAELTAPPKVTITTNGTVYTQRVQRIIEALAPNVVVSLDGASTDTYDSIRVGAHFPDVIANVDRFRHDLGPGKVSLAHCLMTTNWHEFADFLQLAEERDLHVGVNVVRFPKELSLYQLNESELTEVVDTMEATEVWALTGVRSAMWRGHLEALTHRLQVVRNDDGALGPVHGLAGASNGPSKGPSKGPPGVANDEIPWPWAPFPRHDPHQSEVEPEMPTGGFAKFEIGGDGVVHATRVDLDLPVSFAGTGGLHVEALQVRLRAAFGREDSWDVEPQDGDHNRLTIQFHTVGTGPAYTLRIDARRDAEGYLTGGRYLLHLRSD